MSSPLVLVKLLEGLLERLPVLATVKMDILETAGPLQLGAGQDAGCEAAIHAMDSVFSEESTETVLLVDAIATCNAFSSLNR